MTEECNVPGCEEPAIALVRPKALEKTVPRCLRCVRDDLDRDQLRELPPGPPDVDNRLVAEALRRAIEDYALDVEYNEDIEYDDLDDLEELADYVEGGRAT